MVVTVGTSTSSMPVVYPFQPKCFYANGRWWVFYYNGTNFVWRTSVDGVSWNAESVYGAYTAGVIGLWYDLSNNKICLVRVSTTYVYYRQGTANANGSISWDSDEVQVINVGYNVVYPSVCKDSNGYPWVAYRTTSYSYVVKATATDGSSWGNASLLWTNTTDNIADHTIIPLTEGKLLDVGFQYGYVVKSKLFNGTSWGNAVSASSSTVNNPNGFCVVADGDNAHLVFTQKTTVDLLYVKYTYGSGWGSEETVATAISNANLFQPCVCLKTSNNVRVFYFKPDTTVLYRDRDAGVWQDVSTISNGESTITCITCSPYSVSFKFCVVWKSGAGSPFSVRFEQYSLVSLPTVTTQDATDIERY